MRPAGFEPAIHAGGRLKVGCVYQFRHRRPVIQGAAHASYA